MFREIRVVSMFALNSLQEKHLKQMVTLYVHQLEQHWHWHSLLSVVKQLCFLTPDRTLARPHTFPHNTLQNTSPPHADTNTNTLERWAGLARHWSSTRSQVSPPGSLTDTHIWLWLNCINCRHSPHSFGSASHCSGYTRRWNWGPCVNQLIDSPCIL